MTDFESMVAANANVLADFDMRIGNLQDELRQLEAQRATVQTEQDRLERFLAHEKAEL